MTDNQRANVGCASLASGASFLLGHYFDLGFVVWILAGALIVLLIAGIGFSPPENKGGSP